MRRKRFLQLASSYVDGELSGRDLSRFEEAVRSTPEYARLLRSYLKLNGALASARCRKESVGQVKSGIRNSVWIWCVSGSTVGVAAAFLFMAMFTNRVAPSPAAGADRVVALPVSGTPVVEAAVHTNASVAGKPCIMTQRFQQTPLYHLDPARYRLLPSSFVARGNGFTPVSSGDFARDACGNPEFETVSFSLMR